MKSRWPLPALASCIVLATGTLWITKRSDGISGAADASPRTAAGTTPDGPKKTALRVDTNGNAPASPENPLPLERIMEEIEDASVTYDAAALPRIDPYLRHSSPEVRASARNGMVILGDASAGPMLREAARHVTDPREATALLEAADYVELPSAKLHPRGRERPGGPGPKRIRDANSQPR